MNDKVVWVFTWWKISQ